MNRIILLACLLFPASLFAQSPDSGDLSVRFLAERSPKEIGQITMATKDARSAAFDLPSNHLSQRFAPPARAFQLRATTPDVALGSIVLPEMGNSFIVLLIPAPEGGFKSVVIRSDDTAFKQGDTYFYNHCPNPILGFVGTAKFALAPAKGVVLHPSGARKENFYDVGFAIREEKGDRILSRTRWPLDDKVRSYVFFFLNPKTNRPDFRVVDEFIPPTLTAARN